jgi:hypothetical protein
MKPLPSLGSLYMTKITNRIKIQSFIQFLMMVLQTVYHCAIHCGRRYFLLPRGLVAAGRLQNGVRPGDGDCGGGRWPLRGVWLLSTFLATAASSPSSPIALEKKH